MGKNATSDVRPALPADGSELFFVYVKLNKTGDCFDAQLGYVKKRL